MTAGLGVAVVTPPRTSEPKAARSSSARAQLDRPPKAKVKHLTAADRPKLRPQEPSLITLQHWGEEQRTRGAGATRPVARLTWRCSGRRSRRRTTPSGSRSCVALVHPGTTLATCSACGRRTRCSLTAPMSTTTALDGSLVSWGTCPACEGAGRRLDRTVAGELLGIDASSDVLVGLRLERFSERPGASRPAEPRGVAARLDGWPGSSARPPPSRGWQRERGRAVSRVRDHREAPGLRLRAGSRR